MPLYHFYRLVNNVDDICYIGQTRSELRKRLWGHRTPSSRCSAKQLIDKYGRDNITIVLIHSLEFATKEEANREERRLIEEYRGRCVNLTRPYRSEEEKKEQQKAWLDTHTEEVKAQKKEWHETHKEEQKARSKAWREAHKEEVKAQHKAWYDTNKEAYNARRREACAKAKQTINPYYK